MLKLKKQCQYCEGTGRNLAHSDDGPYRLLSKLPKPAKTKEERAFLFEEKVIQFRNKIPGPIRRSLGFILFLPVYGISFFFALLSLIPLWIILGDFSQFWERTYETGAYNDIRYSKYNFLPFLRGTSELFFERPILYDIIRRVDKKNEPG